ncbi:hypothetical protein ACFWAY_22375 [Rhodococcus sp. NPDC059968]|uniref:hypothetical protein n=1 Tax=Rhodococcus sp. NPDC059968 TaxID=3347017 RepID=UPI00366CD1BA
MGILVGLSIISARTTRTTLTIPGGVRDCTIWVTPHGRIVGCRIDPDLAYIDDNDLYLHAAATHGAVE